jgi:hypothetical protein
MTRGGTEPSSSRQSADHDEDIRHVEQIEDTAVYCPECGMPAWIEWSTVLGSTGGDIEHVKVPCFQRHWFFMPASYLHERRALSSG